MSSQPLSGAPEADRAGRARVVVPCYNEAGRLDAAAFLSLLGADPRLDLLFVDDGSTDDTAARLAAVQAQAPARIELHALPRNAGKSEAVRCGLVRAARSAPIVGYLDADLATPPSEMVRLLEVLRAVDADVLLASRVSLLGRDIRRSAVRHYLGRVFASTASLVLRLGVYDTQCGAKLFRATPALSAALADPFLSRWAFDVELLGRLLVGGTGAPPLDPGRVIEEPLRAWRDVPGSKLRGRHMVGAAVDMARIARDLGRRRRAAGRYFLGAGGT